MQELSAYIQSGIIELYVLGDLPPIEMMLVEKLAQRFEVVRLELESIEKALEKYALKNSIEPSQHIRDKVFQILETE